MSNSIPSVTEPFSSLGHVPRASDGTPMQHGEGQLANYEHQLSFIRIV